MRSTLLSRRMSSLGSAQCCSGFSPGTERLASNGATAAELLNRDERAVAEATHRAETSGVENFMVAVAGVVR